MQCVKFILQNFGSDLMDHHVEEIPGLDSIIIFEVPLVQHLTFIRLFSGLAFFFPQISRDHIDCI